MSMLSAQCDELRAMAESIGLAMPQAATLMMEAADTIDRLGGENAKLRDGAYAMRQLYEDELKHALEENAKLRELLADTLMQPHDYCQKYGIEYDGWDSVNDHLDARMRELGVEVE